MRIGQGALYRLSSQDVATINLNRQHFAHGTFPGNSVAEGDVFPAIVVCVSESSVNLHVLLDGYDTYWAPSRIEGDELGQYQLAVE